MKDEIVLIKLKRQSLPKGQWPHTLLTKIQTKAQLSILKLTMQVISTSDDPSLIGWY